MKRFLTPAKRCILSIELPNGYKTNIIHGLGYADASANLIKVSNDEITIAGEPSVPKWLCLENTNDAHPDFYTSREIPTEFSQQVQLNEVSTTMNYMTILKVVEAIPPVESSSCERCREHNIKVNFLSFVISYYSASSPLTCRRHHVLLVQKTNLHVV